MGTTIDPDDPPTDPPGTPGYTPPTSPGTKIAQVVAATNITILSEAIAAAGGPWTNFTVRVTPVNDWGSGTAGVVDVTVSGSDETIIDGQVPLS